MSERAITQGGGNLDLFADAAEQPSVQAPRFVIFSSYGNDSCAPTASGQATAGDGPVVIEASEHEARNWALTVQWPNGDETVELVSTRAAALLGYVPDGGDGDRSPRAGKE